MGTIFISHSSSDIAVARQLALALADFDADPWLAPDRIPPGSDYADEIVKAINECDCVVMLVSQEAMESEQVLREIDTAINHGIRLIPIDLLGSHPLHSMPGGWQYRLRVVQHLRWDTATSAAAAILGLSPGASPSPPSPASPAPVNDEPVYVADSTLVVVRAYLLAAGLRNVLTDLGEDVEMENLPWSVRLLDKMADGELDLCVYNEQAARAWMKDHPGVVEILDHACYSMGGRNFALLAQQGSRWDDVDIDRLRQELTESTNIYVGRDTDRWTNFLAVVGLTDVEIRDRGVKIINTQEPGPGILESDPEALIVGGQNARFEAMSLGTAREVVEYRHLSTEIRKTLRKGSSNVLLVRSETAHERKWDLGNISQKLRANLAGAQTDEDRLSSLVRQLVRSCDFEVSGRRQREHITRHILFETYRIGEPVL